MREFSRPDSFVRPPPASPGDDVAVIAPASGLAAVYPEILELAVERLERQFGLNPVVYPTVERSPEYLSAHPEERAEDVHERFDAVLVGRPQTRTHEHDPGTGARQTYREQQRATVRAVVRRYNPEAVVVCGLDFGHTSPVAPLPIGDRVSVDPAAGSVVFPESC